MIKILTVMDNEVSGNQGLKACHGLSFYIQKDDVKFMFDFGPGPETWENARRMNVPFKEIQYGVFSHSHYDHSSGFLWAEEYGMTGAAAVYGAEDSFFQAKYSAEKGGRGGNAYTYMGCGFSKEYVASRVSQALVCRDSLKLAHGCWAVGNFQRDCLWEQIPGKYVKEEGSKMVPDLFEDEICLALELQEKEAPNKDLDRKENLDKKENGLALIAGCSHPGIVNMVKTVEKRLSMPVRIVIGGIHLMHTDDERIQKTVRELKAMGVKEAAFNHCSGSRLQEILTVNGMKNIGLKTGDCLCL